MKKLGILLLLTTCLTAATTPADDYPGWGYYPSFFSLSDLVMQQGDIFCTSPNGILRYSVADSTYTTYDKFDGLDFLNPQTITSSGDYLYIGFAQNGLVRLDPRMGEFTPIIFPEYVDFANPANSLRINSIIALNDSVLLVAHSEGVDRLNLNSNELRTYSNLSPLLPEKTEVNTVAVFDGEIWACTPLGLAWADVDDPNLEDENAWNSMPINVDIRCIFRDIDSAGDSTIYLGTTRNGVLRFDPAVRDTTHTPIRSGSISGFARTGDWLYITSNEGVYRQSQTELELDDFIEHPTGIISDDADNIWITTDLDGIQHYIDNNYGPIPDPPGPKSSTIYNIAIAPGNVVWCATSDRDEVGKFLQKYQDGTWVYYTMDDGLPSNRTTALLPIGSAVWASSWGSGVFLIDDGGTVEKDDDLFTPVDPAHEVIKVLSVSSGYTVGADIAMDDAGTIWVAGWNFGAYALDGSLPLADNQHHQFEISPEEYVGTVVPGRDGWIWLGMEETGLYGLWVGTDPFNPGDDVLRHVTDSNGLLGYRVLGIAHHPDGSVWVGSEGGLNRIHIQSDRTLTVQDMNDLTDVPFTDISAIEIDGAGNVWVASGNGLYEINPETNRVLDHYTRETSGLISNTVYSLKYDEIRDILWIGTDLGLSSLDLGNGGASRSIALHLYPNPFPIWGYDSRAYLYNLDPEVPVRIYTFSGELVNELLPGGAESPDAYTAVWDGRNFQDEPVGSGVFFIAGVDRDGTPFREKMAVVRR